VELLVDDMNIDKYIRHLQRTHVVVYSKASIVWFKIR